MKKTSRILSVILALAMLLSIVAVMPVSAAAEEEAITANFELDFSQKGAEISEDLWGVFYEDINYAADGGIYPEKIQNRSFEFARQAYNNQTSSDPNVVRQYCWFTVGGATMTTSNAGQSLAAKNPYHLDLTINAAGDGFKNYGFGKENGNTAIPGMYFAEGDKYDVSFFVRGAVNTKATATLYGGGDNADRYVVGSTTFDVVSDQADTEWTQFKAAITAETSVLDANGNKTDDGFIEITFDTPGTYAIDFVSLYPQDTFNNRPNGLRTDLVQKLYDLEPGFVRFPGGCLVEGYNYDNRYYWKDSVGNPWERKQNWNLWMNNSNGTSASSIKNSRYYYNSYGLGFYDYMILCEDIGAQAAPILNCGIFCEARMSGQASTWVGGKDAANVDVAALQPFIDDAIDWIAFCNEPADGGNEWAALRAKMGHPEPFNLKYLGIGNEQQNAVYYQYFHIFEEQIHAVYPDIKLLTSSGTAASGSVYNAAYNWMLHGTTNSPGAKTQDYAYACDEHYYVAESWLYTNTNRYDNVPGNANYQRGDRPLVFAGEYACHIGSNSLARSNNMRTALAEASYMTSLEKNADIVALASYAPLFAKVDHIQWTPDAIWFTDYTSWGSAAYYNQKMFANNSGDYVIPNTIEYTPAGGAFNASGTIGVGTYGTAAYFDDLKVTDNATGAVLYSQNFDDDSITDLATAGFSRRSNNGTWSIVTQDDGNKVLYESATTSSGIYASLTDVANNTWSNYTYEVKAMKTAGAEGFCIPFCYQSTSYYYWLNIAGWSNTQHAIEKGTATQTRSGALVSKAGAINTNQWYTFKMVVSGNKATCYMDGEYLFETTIDNPASSADVASKPYSTACFDEDANEIVIKVTNPIGEDMPTQFKLNGVDSVSSKGTIIQMHDDASTGNTGANSINDQMRVYDKSFSYDGFDTTFTYTLPAYSFTIFRISLNNTADYITAVEPVDVNTVLGVAANYPAQVKATMADGSEKMVDVDWEFKPACLYDRADDYTVYGEINGTNLKAVANLSVVEDVLACDLLVNGVAEGAEAVRNENITVTFTAKEGATKVGLLNENGKWLGKESAVCVNNGDGTESWTVVTSIGSKGERSFDLYLDFGNGLVDTGLNAQVKINAAAPAVVPTEPEFIEIVSSPETAKKGEAFQFTVKTNGDVTKLALCNEIGTGISKNIVSSEKDAEGNIIWTVSTSVGSAGQRTFVVKVASETSDWIFGGSFFTKITK